MIPLVALAAGVLAGVAIGVVTRLVETSRIAFGPYALYGNGALAVPVILAPLAIFAGWAILMRAAPSSPLPEVPYTAGLLPGPGIGYGALAGQPLSPFLLSFGLFVVPAAVFAALTIAALRTRRLRGSTSAMIGAFVLGALVGALPPLSFAGGLGASGVSVGAGLIAGERASVPALLALGAAVAMVVLAQTFAAPLLIGPL